MHLALPMCKANPKWIGDYHSTDLFYGPQTQSLEQPNDTFGRREKFSWMNL